MTPYLWFLYLVATAGGLVVLGTALFVIAAVIGWSNQASREKK